MPWQMLNYSENSKTPVSLFIAKSSPNFMLQESAAFSVRVSDVSLSSVNIVIYYFRLF